MIGVLAILVGILSYLTTSGATERHVESFDSAFRISSGTS